DLSRSVDFYVSLLEMATHDLRQPLQAVVAAHDLLAKRINGGPEQGHLRRGEQASEQLAEILEQLSNALRLYQHFGGIELEQVRMEVHVPGEGFLSDKLGSIFEPSFRMDATR